MGNVTIETIKNCWYKTGILPSLVCEMGKVEDLVAISIRRSYSNWGAAYIVDLVNAEDTENTIEETSPVQLKKARIGLETAFKLFEQQLNNVGIDVSDLRVFRKYMNLLNLKEFQSKRQQNIDAYFSAS